MLVNELGYKWHREKDIYIGKKRASKSVTGQSLVQCERRLEIQSARRCPRDRYSLAMRCFVGVRVHPVWQKKTETSACMVKSEKYIEESFNREKERHLKREENETRWQSKKTLTREREREGETSSESTWLVGQDWRASYTRTYKEFGKKIESIEEDKRKRLKLK